MYLLTKIGKSLILHIKANSHTYFMLFLAFAIGVSAGAFTVNGLSTVQREELMDYFKGFLNLIDNQKIESNELLRISVFENLKIVLVIWILGVSIIGIPFIFVVIGVKGFITGFSSAFIIDTLGAKGGLFTLFTFFPKEVIVIPCIIAIGVRALNFSKTIINNKSRKSLAKENLKTNFISYSIITVLYCVFLIPAILLESYITPILIKMIAPIVSN